MQNGMLSSNILTTNSQFYLTCRMMLLPFCRDLNTDFYSSQLSPSLRADISYFLCSTHEAQEIGDVCAEATFTPPHMTNTWGVGGGGLNLPLPATFNPGSHPVLLAFASLHFSIAKYCAMLRNIPFFSRFLGNFASRPFFSRLPYTSGPLFSRSPRKACIAFPRGGDSHMKVTGMLVVSLKVVNCRFWSHLGCSGQKANIFTPKGIA